MSKSNSGLFKGTIGSKTYRSPNQNQSSLFQSEPDPYDYREHPRKNAITAKQRKEIRAKIANRTATKEEYKKYSSDKRFAERRKRGINSFWNAEQVRVLLNQKTTRPWNEEQRAAIARGERPKYHGKTIQGHHMYSASKFPHLADKGALIYPVAFDEHFYGWHGGNFKKSLPGKPIFRSTFHDFRRD